MQLPGFFVGVSAPLLGGALETGINYLTYTSTLQYLASAYVHGAEFQKRGEHSAASSAHPSDGGQVRLYGPAVDRLRAEQDKDAAHQVPPKLMHVGAAAAVAGATLSGFLSPVELVKCRLQVNSEHFRNPVACLRITAREEGARGLMRGFIPTVAREVPGNALYFTVYEVLVCLHRATVAAHLGARGAAAHVASRWRCVRCRRSSAFCCLTRCPLRASTRMQALQQCAMQHSAQWPPQPPASTTLPLRWLRVA
jgi:hypothetical protein